MLDLAKIIGFNWDDGGKTDDNRALHITFTLRQSGQLIRVISARDMHRKERTIYEQAN